MSSETPLEFPCDFPIKIMGLQRDGFQGEIIAIARQIIPDLDENAIQTRDSRTGKYLAITLTFTATSKAQIDALYLAINKHPDVRMVL